MSRRLRRGAQVGAGLLGPGLLGQGVAGGARYHWIAPAWYVDGDGYAYAEPTLGSELLVNGSFTADSDWTKGTGWTIAGGVGVGTAATGTLNQAVASDGVDHVLTFTVPTYTAGGLRIQIGATQQGPYTATGSYVASGRAAGTDLGFAVATNYTGTVDNASAKLVTGNQHAAIRGRPDQIGIRLVSWQYNQSVRLRWGLDDLDNPQNYIEVRIPTNNAGTSAQILAVKVVAGVSTGFGQTNITFVSNALLEIRRTAATTFQFWYNGTQFFGDQTVSDAAILAGQFVGMAMLCDGWRVSEFQADGRSVPFAFPGVRYLLSDEFATDRAAGAVNGTAAEPGYGPRVVVDTASKLLLSNGRVEISGGKPSPGWGDPKLSVDTEIVRAAGRTIIWRVRTSDAEHQFAVGASDISGNYWGFRFGGAGQLYILDGETPSSGGKVITTYDYTTEYLCCVIMRSDGAWYLIRGGDWSDWRLLRVGAVGTANSTVSVESYDAAISALHVRVRAKLYVPVLLLSDSFNRANGAIGTADGTADADAAAANQAWSALSGTWTISSNEARPTTSGSYGAIATLDAGATDYLIEANVKNVAGVVGFVLRVVDSSNFIVAAITSTTIVARAVISGVNQAFAINLPISMVSGNKVAFAIRGETIAAYYNGAFIGIGTISTPALQTSTIVGIYSSGVGSVLQQNDFKVWQLSHPDLIVPESEASAETPHSVSLYKIDANNLYIYVPISGVSSAIKTRYHFRKITKILSGWGFASNTWHIGGVAIVGDGADIVLMDVGSDSTTINSAVEFAYRIGTADALESTFDFYGGNHQAMKSTDILMTIDGVDISSIGTGHWAYGAEINISQHADIYLPADKATVVGEVVFSHKTTAAGCTVKHAHTYESGYQIFAAYSAMLPSDIDGADQWQIGAGVATGRLQDDGNYSIGTIAASAVMSDTAHDYQLSLTLPSGGPDDAGDWSKSVYGMWFNDRVGDTGKIYVNWVSSTYSERQVAASSNHTQTYHVE